MRSSRRKKTAQARLVDGCVEVRIPSHLDEAQEAEMVSHFVKTFERRRSVERVDLTRRAASLARAHGLEEPDSIRWVGNQEHRWGSCTPTDRTVRISDRVAAFPGWVLDYVIVHELAHLSEPGHDDAFWSLVERYPLTERARGYLIAKGDG